MLKQRIITAAVLIPVVLAVIFLIELKWFIVAVGILAGLAAFEWAALCKLNKLWCYCYSAFAALILVLAWWAFLYMDLGSFVISLLAVVIILYLYTSIYWLYALFVIVLYQRNLLPKFLSKLDFSSLDIGLLVIVSMGCSLIFLRRAENLHGESLLLFLLVLIWSADTAAYFVGKKWGRRKLASRVSPGKTWEGTLAGAAAGGMVAWGYVFFFGSTIKGTVFIGLSLITVCFSVVGDLMESMMKRQAGCKDSGSILPGHGGVLDRIDSLTAAAPIFVMLLLIFGYLP